MKSSRYRSTAIAATFLICLPLALPCLARTSHLVPARIISANNIAFPPDTLAAGTVSFLVQLKETGRIKNVKISRDFPPLTQPALAAVRNWSFAPAELDGKAVPSTIPVDVIFNVFDPNGLKFFNLKLSPPGPAVRDDMQFSPPRLLSAAFARYPVDALEAGTVVLDVTLNGDGALENVRAIRGVPPLTSAAISAVRSFAFDAAEFKGSRVPSRIVVAFVFQYTNPVASQTN